MDDFLFGAILGEHWPMFAAAGVLYGLGRALKALTWRHRRGWFWKAWHKTMTFHPIVAGAVFGHFSGAPSPAPVPTFEAYAGPLYFGAAGFLASFGVKLYRAIKGRQSQE